MKVEGISKQKNNKKVNKVVHSTFCAHTRVSIVKPQEISYYHRYIRTYVVGAIANVLSPYYLSEIK